MRAGLRAYNSRTMREPYRLVSKTDAAATRPVLDRARWQCENCARDDGLRVVEWAPGEMQALCARCRMLLSDVVVKLPVRLRLIAGGLACVLLGCGGEPFVETKVVANDAQAIADASDASQFDAASSGDVGGDTGVPTCTPLQDSAIQCWPAGIEVPACARSQQFCEEGHNDQGIGVGGCDSLPAECRCAESYGCDCVLSHLSGWSDAGWPLSGRRDAACAVTDAGGVVVTY